MDRNQIAFVPNIYSNVNKQTVVADYGTKTLVFIISLVMGTLIYLVLSYYSFKDHIKQKTKKVRKSELILLS